MVYTKNLFYLHTSKFFAKIYWNKLPEHVKSVANVYRFKRNRESGTSSLVGNIWKLSEEIFKRIEKKN